MNGLRRLGLLIAAGALVAGACGDDATPSATTAEPSVTTTIPPTSTTAAPSTTVGTTTTTAPPTTTTQPTPGPAFDSWTVILASLPVEEFSRADAEARLAELAPPEGGLLLSSDYPSLNPGYWVVYSGVFAEGDAARDHCAGLDAECYHRFLGALADTAPVLANGQALLWLETDFLLDLAVVSLETGEVLRTVVGDRGEAEFPSHPVIAPNGRSAFLDIGFEDFWYSCEGVLADMFRVDLATGRIDRFVKGIDPVVSPDGRYLAWSEAPECLEDPDEPLFFIAYHEVVVVRDLETGEETRWGPSAGIAASFQSEIHGKGWAADSQRLYVQLPDGMRELSLATPTDTALDELQIIPMFGYADVQFMTPLGQLQSGELAISWIGSGNEFVAGVDLYDLVSGERTTLAAGDSFRDAAVDSTARSVAWAEGSRLRSAGDVEIDVDVGSVIYGIGW